MAPKIVCPGMNGNSTKESSKGGDVSAGWSPERFVFYCYYFHRGRTMHRVAWCGLDGRTNEQPKDRSTAV